MRHAIRSFALLVVLLPAAAWSEDDPSVVLEARIDSLRVEARYAEAAELAEELIEIGPAEVPDAEHLRDNLFLIASLPTDAQQELAHSDALQAEIVQLMDVDARYDDALALAQEQLEIRRRHLGDSNSGVARSLWSIAALLYYTGDYPACVEAFDELLQITREIYGDEHPATASALGDYAFALQEVGRLDEAEEAHRECIAMNRRVGAPPNSLATGINNLGSLLYERGDFVGAEPAFREALALWREAFDSDHVRIASGLSNLAILLKNRGNPDAAEPLFLEALAMRQRLLVEDHPEIAITMDGYAGLLTDEGRYEEAESYYRESLRMRRAVLEPGHPDIAGTVNDLAFLLDETGRLEEAEELYREALAIRRAALPAGHPALGYPLHNLATVLAESGRPEEAEELLREAIELRTAAFGPDNALRAEDLHVLAQIRRDQGDLDEAYELLAEACRVHEAVRHRAGTGVERATFQTSPWPEMAALHLARGETAEAWPALERSLARSLADLLAEAEARELTAEESAAEDSLRTALAGLRDELRVLDESDGEVVSRSREEIRDELTGMEASWSRLQLELAERYPVSEGKALPLERVQAALPPGVAMVGWLDVTIADVPRAAAWVLRGDRPVAWTSLVEVNADSRGVRRALRAVYEEEAARESLSRTYEERFRPVEMELAGVDALIIVPSPATNGLPVEALLDDGGRFLDDRFTISYAPSASLVAWIAERAPPPPATKGERPALLVGNPPFRADGVVIAAADAVTEDVFRSAARGNRNALDQLPALPGTEAEVRSLQPYFPQHTVLLGEDASEQRLWDLAGSDLEHYRVLHFATHGIPDDQRPELSALVFSQVGLPDPLESVLAGERIYDGIVSAGEIVSDWQLDADLVTLSACETALGKEVAGEGYVGLAYAFYQAGARSQLVGLWQVEDVATALLMERFYGNWIDGGLSKAAALAEAKRWLRQLSFDEVEQARERFGAGSAARGGTAVAASVRTEWFDEAPYAHPFFWAPFVLLGDPR